LLGEIPHQQLVVHFPVNSAAASASLIRPGGLKKKDLLHLLFMLATSRFSFLGLGPMSARRWSLFLSKKRLIPGLVCCGKIKERLKPNQVNGNCVCL